jgi:anti-sigma factor RsiW
MRERADIKREPNQLLGAVLDRLNADEADGLLEVLETDAEAPERLKAYARQRRQLRRSANALEGKSPSLTDTLAERLQGRLRAIRAGRRMGAMAVAVAFGLAMGEISDRVITPDSYYGFETENSRVVERGPLRHVSLEASEASQIRLSGWIGRRVIMPDLTSAGLTFREARLIDVGELRLVGLVYIGADGELILCQSPDLDGLVEAPELIRTANVQAGYWSDGRRTFALMAGLDQPEIHGLMSTFSRLTAAGIAASVG